MKTKSTSPHLFINEFIKEEALLPEQKTEVALEIVKNEPAGFHFPGPESITEDDRKAGWHYIRNFFRTGEKQIPPSLHDSARSFLQQNEPSGLMPVLLAPFHAKEELNTDYPLFLPDENNMEYCSFSDLLGSIFKQSFHQGEAGILFKNLPGIEKSVRKYVAENGNICSAKAAFDKALHELTKLKIKGQDAEGFLKDLEKFNSNFPPGGKLLGISPLTPVYLLLHLLKHHSGAPRNKEILEKIRRLKSGLQDLIAVEKSKKTKSTLPDSTPGDLEDPIADTFIELDKLDRLRPESASVPMSKKRVERIARCIQVLDSVDSLLLKYRGIIFLGKTLADHPAFVWDSTDEIFQGFDIRVAPADKSCLSASNEYKTHITGLTEFMASVRIAELEINNKFDEDIHGDFFSRFNRHYFTEEETTLCPPVIIMEETRNLLGKELPHFLHLVTSHQPVKVLAIHPLLPPEITDASQEEDRPLFQQELGALAISHRNIFTHQSAIHLPLHVLQGFENGLNSPSPALFHVLTSALPEQEQPGRLSTVSNREFLEISSAVEGRQLALFTYNARGGKWGSRFGISDNPQPDKDWPRYTVEVTTDGKPDKLDLDFTFADYFAFYTYNHNKLLVVPPACWTGDLIPLSEYLRLSPDQLYSKVPFIWLTDPSKTLHKAAVPYSLVIAVKERLDYWNYIQELGGVNNFHVEQAISRTRKEMQEQKETDIRNLESEFRKKIDEVRTSAAEEAMNNLAGMLLDLENFSASPSIAKPATTPASIPVTGLKTPEIPAAAETSTEKEIPVSTEPWIDSFRCTSCNDCTDKYPRAFKYNSEKQAYIDDPTTITFAQMVKAAEACPAKCIHPGMPLNPNEPGLEDLIARAKPLN